MQAVSKTQNKANYESGNEILSSEVVRNISFLSRVFSYIKNALLSDIKIERAVSYNKRPDSEFIPNNSYSRSLEAKNTSMLANNRNQLFFK